VRVQQVFRRPEHARIVIDDSHGPSALVHQGEYALRPLTQSWSAAPDTRYTMTELSTKETCPFGRAEAYPQKDRDG
jgi:hypothetical protein